MTFQKTGIRIPDTPMKLCDLKPFYGIIHSEMLKDDGYEWWGFGDIDLVYGNLDSIIKLTTKKKYNLISTHIKCIAGHFTLIRFASKLTKLPMKIPQIKECIEDNDNHWVDETLYSLYVREKKTRIIDFFWFKIGGRFRFNRNKFYNLFSYLIPGWQHHCLYEYRTSFRPLPGQKFIINLDTLKWDINKNYFPTGIVPNSDLPYLHFVWFKGRYNDEKDVTKWDNYFWEIPKDYKWRGNEKVEISLDGIKIL